MLEDLSEVDPKAEVEWFAREYQEQLEELARHFGVEPRIRWGLLSW